MSESTEISETAVASALKAALLAVHSAADSAELKAARIAHAGESSPLARFNAQLGEVPVARRANAGRLVGHARNRVSDAVKAREQEISAAEEASMLRRQTVDVTAAASRWEPGARHPLSLLMERIADIFVGMGWEVAEGPELENEWFNFDALNFGPDHPARALQDTLFIDPVESHLVLRTHTSPVQVRTLLDRPLPVFVIAPGRVYRTDELDATHTPVFHQVEGIAVDRGLTMAHLRGTLERFARDMFGDEARIRLRPNYFPFTEPSAELDVWHAGAKGGPRWIEWGGCGMVNPNVLRSIGIDPEDYSGFAFGIGVERTLQFRNDINDMRDMVEGDVRFSHRFGMVI